MTFCGRSASGCEAPPWRAIAVSRFVGIEGGAGGAEDAGGRSALAASFAGEAPVGESTGASEVGADPLASMARTTAEGTLFSLSCTKWSPSRLKRVFEILI